MITATNRATGEVIELLTDTPVQIVQAWKIAQEYEKTAKALKDQLKELVPTLVNELGVSETIDSCMFRVSNVQRRNYDKATMRQVLDEDTYDLLVKPDKSAVDKFLKDAVMRFEAGDIAAQLRDSMVDDGKPYQVIKLEKL